MNNDYYRSVWLITHQPAELRLFFFFIIKHTVFKISIIISIITIIPEYNYYYYYDYDAYTVLLRTLFMRAKNIIIVCTAVLTKLLRNVITFFLSFHFIKTYPLKYFILQWTIISYLRIDNNYAYYEYRINTLTIILY